MERRISKLACLFLLPGVAMANETAGGLAEGSENIVSVILALYIIFAGRKLFSNNKNTKKQPKATTLVLAVSIAIAAINVVLIMVIK